MPLDAESTLRMTDGQTLFVRVDKPVSPPHGWVMLIHGIAEHSGRYDHVVERFNQSGYGTLRYDLRGHGETATGPPTAHFDSFDECVADAQCVHAYVQELAGESPVFILGHSMGALVLLSYLIQLRDQLAGAVLTALPLLPFGDVGRIRWPLVRLLSAVCPRAPMVQLHSAKISRDPDQVAKYDSDPLNFRGRLTVRSAVELLRAARVARNRLCQVKVPLLLMHGTADRIARIEGSQLLLQESTSIDKRLRECDGLFHEVLNEPEWPALVSEIVGWFDAHLE